MGARGASGAASAAAAAAGAGAGAGAEAMALAARARRAESTIQSIAQAVAQMEKATHTTQLKMERTEAAVRSMARRSKVQGKMVQLIGKRMNELEERLNQCADAEPHARPPFPAQRGHLASADLRPRPSCPSSTPSTDACPAASRLPRSQSCSAAAPPGDRALLSPAVSPSVRRSQSQSVCQQAVYFQDPLRRPIPRSLSQNTIKRSPPRGVLHPADIPPSTFSFTGSSNATVGLTARPSTLSRFGNTPITQSSSPPVNLTRGECKSVPQSTTIRPPVSPTRLNALPPPDPATARRNPQDSDAWKSALLKNPVFGGVPSPPPLLPRPGAKRRCVSCSAGPPGAALRASASSPAQPTAAATRRRSVPSHVVAAPPSPPHRAAEGVRKSLSCVDDVATSHAGVERSASCVDTSHDRPPALPAPARRARLAVKPAPAPGSDSASSAAVRVSPPSPRAGALSSTKRLGHNVAARKSPALSRSVSCTRSTSPAAAALSPSPCPSPPPSPTRPSPAAAAVATVARSCSSVPPSLVLPRPMCCFPPPRLPPAARARACCRKCLSALGRYLLALAHEGRIEDARTLLDTGVDVNFPNTLKWTPLHKAAAKAHEVMVSLLLHRGANVHARTSYGFTALHLAAYNDRGGRCVALLINAGADLHCLSRSGRTPLDYAHECRNGAAVRALVSAGASSTSAGDDDD